MKTMKKMKTFAIFSSIALSTTIMFSCSKQGCTNASALNYDSNAKKDNGTCVFNNVSSQIVTVGQNEWIGDGDGYSVTKSLSILNSSIASNGVVMAYMKDGEDYTAMPLTFSSGQGLWISHMIFTHNSNSITFINYDDDGLTPNPGSSTFKVVCISNSGLNQNPNVDLTNYKEVEKAFNL